MPTIALNQDDVADLAALVMSPEAKAARRQFVNASELPIIISGDMDAINRLARIKLGLEDDEDTSESLPAMLGLWIEPFNLAWLRQSVPEITDLTGNSQRVAHPNFSWLACTPDAYGQHTEHGPFIAQAKFLNPFQKEEVQLRKYLCQVHAEMGITGIHHACISLMRANTQHTVAWMKFDAFYFTEVRRAAQAFWDSVQAGKEPHPRDPPPPPMGWEELVPVSMEGNNAWADAAARYLEHEGAADAFDTAKGELKKLMPGHARQATGYGVEIKRNRAGALTVKRAPLPQEKAA
jgi:hypothetical protein